jgi:hypothetical protein
MTKQDLEKIMMVNLYTLEESGYNILHDTPAIGVWTTCNHWSKTHGPYTSKEEAEKHKTRLRAKLAKMYDHSDTEYDLELKKHIIPESELFVKNGKYYYITEMKELGNTVEDEEE